MTGTAQPTSRGQELRKPRVNVVNVILLDHDMVTLTGCRAYDREVGKLPRSVPIYNVLFSVATAIM